MSHRHSTEHFYPKDYKHAPPRVFNWWYLSFVDSKGWLGACCVEADSIQDAAAIARTAGCNPGGEVLGLALNHDDPVPAALQYKLVTDEAMLELLLGEIMQISSAGMPCVECEKEHS